MGRLAAVLALLACLLAPAAAWAATPADLIGAYVAQRDDAVAGARDAIAAAGPGSPDARVAATDARARLASLADALRTSTAGDDRAAVEARLAADERIAAALAAHGAGRIDADGLDAALADAAALYERDRDGATADTGGMALADIVQALGGPLLLVGAVALMSWRAARRRRAGITRR